MLMRALPPFSALSLMLLVPLIAAWQAAPDVPVPGPDADTLVATIDGQAYDAGFAVSARRCPIPGRCTIVVRTKAEATFGEDAPPTTELRLTLRQVEDEPATYDLTRLSRARVSVPNGAGVPTIYAAERDGGRGTVEVTAISEAGFEGTFAFTAVAEDGSTITVTDGTFSLEFV